MSEPAASVIERGSAQPLGGALAPELSVIVPTFNESANVGALIERLESALAGIRWEVVFVDDDSPDGTSEAVRKFARMKPHVRGLQRIGRRGLSSACIEGALSSSAPYIAVMDGDLQHDERLIPRMLDELRSGARDVVVGSRYVEGGSVGDWDAERQTVSRIAIRLSRVIVRAELSDPMSGFFMISRAAFDGAVRRLSGKGFKILLDLLASAPQPLRLKELPFTFRSRHAGVSKLDTFVAWEYLMMLIDKLVGHIVPVRFVLFSIVGGIGVLTHLAVLWLALAAGLPFYASQGAATGIAMVGNFALNNWLTYRDQKLRGWGFVTGLLSFVAICGFGAVANVGVSNFFYSERETTWWLAGLAGSAISAVWNYAATSIVTWKRR